MEGIMVKLNKRLSVVAVALAFSGLSTAASAGGFGIGTQSGSGTGNAFAGGAAAAEDASVAWSNPAAMMALPAGREAVVSGHIVLPSFKFTNTGSTVPGTLGTGNGGDGGDLAFIPNAFYKMDISPKLRFGFAVNVPFGLSTEFSPGWQGQTIALESAIKTINLNPSLGYKISDTVSIGGGVSLQKIEAKLSRFTGAATSGNVTLSADDIGYGYNLGLLVQMTPGTRIGLAYRSSIDYTLEGTAIFTGTSAAALNGNVTAKIKVPDSTSLSVFSTMGGRVEVMADLTYTGWGNIKSLDVYRTSGALLSSDPYNWKDTLRVGVGANYKLDPNTKLRFGLAFDPTPTNDVNRTPRLPDQDRTWRAFGVQYKMGQSGTVDVGYAHEFVKDSTVNNAAAAGRLIGTFSNKADILSVQYSHRF
jgi:long-chain fatty acid transport protein